jgi:hypothetical protein
MLRLCEIVINSSRNGAQLRSILSREYYLGYQNVQRSPLALYHGPTSDPTLPLTNAHGRLALTL